MSPELFSQIENIKSRAPSRVFPVVDDSGHKLWIKLAVKPKYKFWHRIQALAAMLSGYDILKPTVCQGGIDALKAESKRLQALAAKGFLVPQALAFGPDWMALNDVGNSLPSLNDSMEKNLCLAAALLADLHKKQGWHGNAVARNFVVTAERNLGLIDLEEDLAPIMPLAARQARDIVLFLSSAVALRQGNMEQITWAYLANNPPLAVGYEISLFLRLFSPLASMLRRWNDHLGRDLQRVLQVEKYLLKIANYKEQANV